MTESTTPAAVVLRPTERFNWRAALLIAPAIVMLTTELVACAFGLGWSVAPLFGFGETATLGTEGVLAIAALAASVSMAVTGYRAERALLATQNAPEIN